MRDTLENDSLYEKRRPNNVAINLNKYIAKYDFDIAMKLKPDFDKDDPEE